jgi:cell division protein FtsN
MARKKPRRRAPRSKKPAPLPGWIWMLFGLTVGLAVAAAIYINDRRAPGAPAAAPAPAKPPPAASGDPAKPAATQPRFDFYEMLPKFEVVIPEQDLDARPDVAPAAVEKPGAYVLQAGSFSTFEDADRMKARLALLGVVSRIQKVTVDDRTFHRVRIGPLDNLDELNRTREQLREARVEIMVIRIAD